ncbi:twin arginine-targeting protein translocase TatC [Moraxella nonliquefaciens]|uniref:Sec-independent protein translocase protein TatC n=2 Tax=Moraxella nonliquefaciens TaxID=478 RepID=A0A1B8QKV3_MORNO|nr:twin arginine-targeting protein translocase TatC [Moraxella nonliquefaciens]OBX84143.1 twin arginine-targeting protein translocase TatC [Moraxella nonliquefaciens]QPT45531.1 twin-arginine translocase subunit TatC [Moraxella nonliquefaciens]QQC30736.1 twin-arginine translocase subunit TatC [Moraxella nonliquefaciens]
MSLMAHFAELRTRFIYIIMAVVAVFLPLMYVSRSLYDLISRPLVALLPHNASIIATQVASGFLAPIKLAFFMALFICVPFIIAQIWGFVAPALYKHEKRAVVPLLLSAIVLFYVGVAFAYFVVLVPALKFLVLFAPDNVLPMTDIESYLDFVIKLFLVFGLMFEIPVATMLLVLMRIVTPKQLATKRRYVIVGCFFVSAIITPPDGASMLMLAIPMCILFELGLMAASMFIKPDKSIAQ